jgi:hypothetical protein
MTSRHPAFPSAMASERAAHDQLDAFVDVRRAAPAHIARD